MVAAVISLFLVTNYCHSERVPLPLGNMQYIFYLNSMYCEVIIAYCYYDN